MDIAATALLISIVSLIFSIYIGVTTIRTGQLQKFSDFRLLFDETIWALNYRLKDIESFMNSIPDDKKELKESYRSMVIRQKLFILKLEKAAKNFEKSYKMLKLLPIPIPVGHLENLLFNIKSMKLSIDISRKEIIPELKESEKIFKSAEKIIDSITDNDNESVKQ